MRDFGKDFFWDDKKRNPGFSFFMSNNCIMTKKLSGILLNYYYYYFLIGLFLFYVLGRWTFFGPGSSLKDFFWV